MESLSMVSHTNALIKNRETIDINLYEQFIKYLDASPICCLLLTTVTVKKECLIPSIITDSKI